MELFLAKRPHIMHLTLTGSRYELIDRKHTVLTARIQFVFLDHVLVS